MSSETRLLIIILRDTDGDEVLNALLEANFRVTRIASSGGFMRRRSSTLLVGVTQSKVNAAIQIVRNHSAPTIDPGLKRATVFELNVDQFKQI